MIVDQPFGPPPGKPPEVLQKFLPECLSSNPVFFAGFGMGVLGMGLTALKQSSSILMTLGRRRLLTTLEIPSKDKSYNWVMQWLINQSQKTRHLGIQTSYHRTPNGQIESSFQFVPGCGRHIFFYQGSIIAVERGRDTKVIDLQTGAPWETLTLTTVSFYQTSLFTNLLAEARNMAVSRESGKTLIYQGFGSEWREYGNPKSIRPFHSVFLDGQISHQILEDVQDFLGNQKWYLDRGIPYRRGYLLHGPPGCGKSSYVMALAGALGYNICLLSLGDPMMTDDRLAYLLAVVPPQSILLLEDIDSALPNHGQSPHFDEASAGLRKATFSGLLNALDGVAATEERLVFMTTNFVDKLPAALVRPGRVDLKCFIGYCSFTQAKLMFEKFYPGSNGDIFGQLLSDSQKQVSAADIQGFLLFYKDRPEKALEEAYVFFKNF